MILRRFRTPDQTPTPDSADTLAPESPELPAPEPVEVDEPRAADEPPAAADYEQAVARTRQGLGGRLRALLRGSEISDETWVEVEEALIAADVGAELAIDVVDRARQRKDVENAEAAVIAELIDLFAPRDPTPWPRIPAPGVPAVVLVVGVNGTGKTTTIAKLAHRFSTRGAKVLLAAADTFRAAASEQLQVWAGRVDVPVVAHAPGADPSAVVFDALDAAAARGSNVVIADTAGRLHTKSNLMDELAKIRRTINKRLPEATPEVLFILDATTGQNGLAQARAFHEAAPLSGIVLTKLDSTARGGIAFAIEEALGVPVLFVGVGEKVDDLLDFNPNAFVEALFA
ncbi:signal recognition particle-docking protein FtsY [soil metagenome]